jgi:hypothetical protein
MDHHTTSSFMWSCAWSRLQSSCAHCATEVWTLNSLEMVFISPFSASFESHHPHLLLTEKVRDKYFSSTLTGHNGQVFLAVLGIPWAI